jgi:pimeloyl-ACP methyl ester carboxylesterase
VRSTTVTVVARTKKGREDRVMEHIEVDGLRIGFERRGHGPPLVLLHGLPGDSRIWQRQLDDLADEYSVVAWDAPGCGRSADPAGDLGLGDVTRSLAGFINALGLRQAHVVGISWGGGLALELYRSEPTLVRTLVLASAYAGWAGSLPADVVAGRLQAYLDAAQQPSMEAMRDWMPEMFSETVTTEVATEVLTILSEFHPRPFTMLARSFAETDLRDMLASIAVPTLLLYGDADTRAPLYVAEELHSRIPGATLEVMSGVGHLSNLEAPDRFNAQVRSFLRATSG